VGVYPSSRRTPPVVRVRKVFVCAITVPVLSLSSAKTSQFSYAKTGRSVAGTEHHRVWIAGGQAGLTVARAAVRSTLRSSVRSTARRQRRALCGVSSRSTVQRQVRSTLQGCGEHSTASVPVAPCSVSSKHSGAPVPSTLGRQFPYHLAAPVPRHRRLRITSTRRWYSPPKWWPSPIVIVLMFGPLSEGHAESDSPSPCTQVTGRDSFWISGTVR
jgi:hypothetical protein